MGLDMFACTLARAPEAEVDFEAAEWVELHCWLDHPGLHGWMEALYRVKGGAAEEFNCVNLVLTAHDLDLLERVVLAGRLPETDGFAFKSDGSERGDDVRFIAEAREAIAAERTVFVTSSW